MWQLELDMLQSVVMHRWFHRQVNRLALLLEHLLWVAWPL